jgi:hypothetical protein
MSNDPDAGEDQPLEPPVSTPGSPATDFSANWAEVLLGRIGLEVWVDIGRKSPCHGSQQDIARKVQEPARSIPDKELFGNGGSNFLQGPLYFYERLFLLKDESRLTKAWECTREAHLRYISRLECWSPC